MYPSRMYENAGTKRILRDCDSSLYMRTPHNKTSQESSPNFELKLSRSRKLSTETDGHNISIALAGKIYRIHFSFVIPEKLSEPYLDNQLHIRLPPTFKFKWDM